MVRLLETGIFEGTWVGDGGAHGPLNSTTTFGSGVFVDDGSLLLVTPGHMLEGIYVGRLGEELACSNSLVGLLSAAGLELDPAVMYPPLFNESVDGIRRTSIPTLSTAVTACFYDNVRVGLDLDLTVVEKSPEPAFRSYDEYLSRLTAALGSALANAAPGMEPLVTISSGYDSAAVAALSVPFGCRRAVTVAEGKPVPRSDSLSDSGAVVGRMLGLQVESFERLAYLRRDDLVEAEFLATGFSGEEVVLVDMAETLAGTVLLSGFFGDGMWWMNRPRRATLWRSDQSGSSLGEWRLRVGFVHVPLPCFGGRHYRSTQAISRLPEMKPWMLGRAYDKPIPRRILEGAGIPRGAFADTKRAASATIHTDGPRAMAPASVASLERFAAAEGRTIHFQRRPPPRLWRRVMMKAARKLGAEPIAARLESAKHGLAAHDPAFGSLLLRWAVSVVRPRYADVVVEATPRR